MSIILSNGTKPADLKSKVHCSFGARAVGLVRGFEFGSGGRVQIGDYNLSMKDMMELAFYALINTNIEGDTDPRVEFVSRVKGLVEVDGFVDDTVTGPHKRFAEDQQSGGDGSGLHYGETH